MKAGALAATYPITLSPGIRFESGAFRYWGSALAVSVLAKYSPFDIIFSELKHLIVTLITKCFHHAFLHIYS
jgi:hypothetical protein